MKIVGRERLDAFGSRHADLKKALSEWTRVVQAERWAVPRDALRLFPRASVIGGSRIVFRLRGNAYRLIARVNFPFQIVEIRFIGTHAEYDKVDAERV